MTRLALEFEVVVVGAGPAGIAAACAAAENGARVAILDNTPWLGGQIWRGESAKAGRGTPQRWLERLGRSGTKVLSQTTAFAAPQPRVLQAEQPQGVLEIAWQKLILATGAREFFLPFPGWTLPGVIGPGGLQAMVKAGWPVAGKRVVVAGTGPLLLAAADGLKAHGADVGLIAEQQEWSAVMRFGAGLLRYPGKLMQGLAVKARLAGVPYRCGCWPVRAQGESQVQSVALTNGSRTWSEPCDYLACGFHLVPNLELPSLLGCAIEAGAVSVNEFQETSIQSVFCAGEPTGVGGAECALAEGRIAGLAATGRVEQARARFAERARWHRFRRELTTTFALRPELQGLATAETIVCRCEDVPRGQLQRHTHWREAKLHTRCGMGACQGRVCGSAAQFLFGWTPDSVRPPVLPVSMGALAGAAMPMHNTPTQQPTKA